MSRAKLGRENKYIGDQNSFLVWDAAVVGRSTDHRHWNPWYRTVPSANAGGPSKVEEGFEEFVGSARMRQIRQRPNGAMLASLKLQSQRNCPWLEIGDIHEEMLRFL
jgi:hypothetical protein